MTGTPSPDLNPNESGTSQDQQTPEQTAAGTSVTSSGESATSKQPGSKAITGFAAVGILLAIGIGAWTWNSSIPATVKNADNASAEQSSAQSVSADKSTTANEDKQESSSSNESSGSSVVNGEPNSDKYGSDNGAVKGSSSDQPWATAREARANHDSHQEGKDTPSSGFDLAPLANGDPYLPPDSWGGKESLGGPRKTLIDAVPTEHKRGNGAEPIDTESPSAPHPSGTNDGNNNKGNGGQKSDEQTPVSKPGDLPVQEDSGIPMKEPDLSDILPPGTPKVAEIPDKISGAAGGKGQAPKQTPDQKQGQKQNQNPAGNQAQNQGQPKGQKEQRATQQPQQGNTANSKNSSQEGVSRLGQGLNSLLKSS